MALMTDDNSGDSEGLTLRAAAQAVAKEQLAGLHSVFISCGHDEYWSMEQRMAVKFAIHEFGMHAVFWSGNEMYWKIRFERDVNAVLAEGGVSTTTATGAVQTQPNNPIIAIFKETRIRDRKLDDSSPIWTGTWRDTHFAFAEGEGGPLPENEITGQLYTVDTWVADPMVLPWYLARHRIWRNIPSLQSHFTSAAKQSPPAPFVFRKPLIGHEFDEDIDNGYRPPGLQHLTETDFHNVLYLLDSGTVYDTGSARHHLTMYRHPTSQAIVFGAGSIIFSWALSPLHDSANGIPPHMSHFYSCRVTNDLYGEIPEIQQAMMNLFGDMGVDKPVTLQNGLVFDGGGGGVSAVGDKTVHSQIDCYDDENEEEKKYYENNCLRIEGTAVVDVEVDVDVDSDNTSLSPIIAGVEVLIRGHRWFAAVIDYNYTATDCPFQWYFEFYVAADGDTQQLAFKSRAVDDTGQLEITSEKKWIYNARIAKCKGDNDTDEHGKWRWRQRPKITSPSISPQAPQRSQQQQKSDL